LNIKLNSSTLGSHRFLVIMLGLLALIVSCLPLTRGSDDLLFNAYMRFLPAVSNNPRTVIVTLDDMEPATGGALSHARLAELIVRLKKAHVAATGLLLPLVPQPTTIDVERLHKIIATFTAKTRKSLEATLATIKGDERLVKAMRRSGNVVLPVGYLPAGESVRWVPEQLDLVNPGQTEQGTFMRIAQLLSAPPAAAVESRRFPGSIFMSSARALGIFNRDNNTSAARLFVPTSEGLFPTFLMQLVARKISSNHDNYAINSKGVRLAEKFITTGPDYRLFAHPHKLAQENDQVLKAGDILGGRNHRFSLRNKIVLVGFISDERLLAAGLVNPADMGMMTAMTRSIDALISGQYYSQPEWLYGIQRGMVVLVVIILLLLPERFRGYIGSIICLALAFLILNLSLLLLITQNTWLPFTIPVWLLLCASLVMPLRHRLAGVIFFFRRETERAYRDLAQNHQSQGHLDIALDCLSKCPVNTVTAEPLYSLGMDYERRRQFGKALSIYQRIAQAVPGYRDTQERSVKLSEMPETFSNGAVSTDKSGPATIIFDDTLIARPVIGRYQIVRELGRGAMGMVYLGNDPKIARTVAIKTMALAEEFESGHLEDVKRRFYKEAETAGQLNHPNIVTIFDVGEEHDLAYIAMDYIEGKSLDYYTRAENLLPLESVFDIGIHIAEALDYAHERKVVHRDVKPANIMYDSNKHVLKIMDFGIACLTDNSKTRTGAVLGSPFYMSPEQIAGRRVDGRSDLYSLGVTLYQLFTGQLPFSGDSMAALMYQIANARPAGIRKIRSDLPACLGRIINRSLEKNIDKRFQSGRLLADALFSCAERQGLTVTMRARR